MKGPPFHILVKRGDIAEKVIVAGDPARVRQIASYLENPVLVNENRGLLVYTGMYKDTPITVATHGIGSGSSTIVIEELAMMGAKYIVRLGTAGSLVSDLKTGDFLIVTGAACIQNGNSLGLYAPGFCLPTAPSPILTNNLLKAALKRNEKVLLGPVFSSDAFYAESSDFVKYWSERGILAVEMECASLFALSWMRKFHAGALVVISDTLVGEKSELLTSKELEPRVKIAAEIVLDALLNTSI